MYKTLIDITDCEPPTGQCTYNVGDLVRVSRQYIHGKNDTTYPKLHQYLFETGTVCEISRSATKCMDGKYRITIKFPRLFCVSSAHSQMDVEPEFLDLVYDK